jgi:DNA-binding NarL/FixJ family response regulator
MKTKTITIGIAEDQEIYRSGLESMLNCVDNFKVTILASEGKELLLKMKGNEPDVVLLDYRMEGLNGAKTATKISKRHSKVKILMLSMYDAQEFVIKSIESGADGYITKDDDPNEIIMAIESVVKDGYYLNDRTSKMLISRMVKTGKGEPKFETSKVEFTAMELEVIDLICKEFSTEEISKKLYKSKRTVDGHRSSIMKKINARNGIGIVLYAIRNNIVKL